MPKLARSRTIFEIFSGFFVSVSSATSFAGASSECAMAAGPLMARHDGHNVPAIGKNDICKSHITHATS